MGGLTQMLQVFVNSHILKKKPKKETVQLQFKYVSCNKHCDVNITYSYGLWHWKSWRMYNKGKGKELSFISFIPFQEKYLMCYHVWNIS